MKNIIIKRDGVYSVQGGVLTSGDINAYRILIDMGTDASDMTAMAVCQENGEFSADYSVDGSVVSVVLANSMYKDEGYITVRFAVSEGDSVLTAKEIIFRVVKPNNTEAIAENHGGTLSDILTAVRECKSVSDNSLIISNQALALTMAKADADSVYTRSEIDSRISSVYRYRGSADDYDGVSKNPDAGDTYNILSDCRFPMKVLPVTVDYVSDEWDEVGWIDVGFEEMEELYDIQDDTGCCYADVYDSRGNYIGTGDYYRDEYFHIRSSHVLPPYGRCYLRFAGKAADACYTEQIQAMKVKAGDNVAWTGNEWDVLSGTVDLSSYATKDYIDSALGLALEGEY